MKLNKQATLHIETFVRNLKKKEKQIDEFSKEVGVFFNAMVEIKNYLGTVYDNAVIPISERTKIFMDKLKELEILGEKHDNTVKKIKELREKINQEIDILISTIGQSNDTLSKDQIRHHILQYIESKR